MREAIATNPSIRVRSLNQKENSQRKEEKCEERASDKVEGDIFYITTLWSPRRKNSFGYDPNFHLSYNLVIEGEGLGRAEHENI